MNVDRYSNYNKREIVHLEDLLTIWWAGIRFFYSIYKKTVVNTINVLQCGKRSWFYEYKHFIV